MKKTYIKRSAALICVCIMLCSAFTAFAETDVPSAKSGAVFVYDLAAGKTAQGGDMRYLTYTDTENVWAFAGYSENWTALDEPSNTTKLRNNQTYGVQAQCSAAGQWFAVKIEIPTTGRYKFMLKHGSGPKCAVSSIYVAPASTERVNWQDASYRVGQVDYYSEELLFDVRSAVGMLDVTTAGEYIVSFCIDSKNEASANYNIYPGAITLDGLDMANQRLTVDFLLGYGLGATNYGTTKVIGYSDIQGNINALSETEKEFLVPWKFDRVDSAWALTDDSTKVRIQNQGCFLITPQANGNWASVSCNFPSAGKYYLNMEHRVGPRYGLGKLYIAPSETAEANLFDSLYYVSDLSFYAAEDAAEVMTFLGVVYIPAAGEYTVAFKGTAVGVSGGGRNLTPRKLFFDGRADYAKNPEDFSISDIGIQGYTGSAISPNVGVLFDGAALTQDDDYTVSFSDNTALGSASAQINFTGNYLGSVQKSFEIALTDEGLAKSELTAPEGTPGEYILTYTYPGSSESFELPYDSAKGKYIGAFGSAFDAETINANIVKTEGTPRAFIPGSISGATVPSSLDAVMVQRIYNNGGKLISALDLVLGDFDESGALDMVDAQGIINGYVNN